MWTKQSMPLMEANMLDKVRERVKKTKQCWRYNQIYSITSFVFYDRGGTCLWKKEPQLYSLIPTTKQKPYDNMYKSNQQYIPTYVHIHTYIHTCKKNCRDFLLLSCLSREQCNVSLYVYWSFGPRFTVYAYMFLTQLASQAEETGEENITSTFHYILL